MNVRRLSILYLFVVITAFSGITLAVCARAEENKLSGSESEVNDESKILEERKKVIEHDPASRMFRADKIIGDDILNSDGSEIGEIEDLIIDPESGRIVYAVISFGELFDFKSVKIFVIPWKALQYDKEKETLKIDITEQRLKKAPGFYKDYTADVNDPEWIKEIHLFYTIHPYWWSMP